MLKTNQCTQLRAHHVPRQQTKMAKENQLKPNSSFLGLNKMRNVSQKRSETKLNPNISVWNTFNFLWICVYICVWDGKCSLHTLSKQKMIIV